MTLILAERTVGPGRQGDKYTVERVAVGCTMVGSSWDLGVCRGCVAPSPVCDGFTR